MLILLKVFLLDNVGQVEKRATIESSFKLEMRVGIVIGPGFTIEPRVASIKKR